MQSLVRPVTVALLFRSILSRMDKRFISFETVSGSIDFDNEQSAVQPIFARIVDVLEKAGVEVLVAPCEWDSYGWYADFKVGAAKLTCMMQRSDSWLLSLFADRSFMDWLKARKYEAELAEFSGMLMVAVQEATGVRAKLYNSPAELLADQGQGLRPRN
jgi:hypothetical protein